MPQNKEKVNSKNPVMPKKFKLKDVVYSPDLGKAGVVVHEGVYTVSVNYGPVAKGRPNRIRSYQCITGWHRGRRYYIKKCSFQWFWRLFYS